MNRTGLVIALAIGAVVGVVFAVWPQLDVAISHPFFNETYRVFPIQYSLVARHLRDLFTYMIAGLVAPAFIALAIKLVLRRRRMLMLAPPPSSPRPPRPLPHPPPRARARPDGEYDPEGSLGPATPRGSD